MTAEWAEFRLDEYRRPTGHDIEDDQVRRVVTDFGATEVAPEDVYGIDADIFSCG